MLRRWRIGGQRRIDFHSAKNAVFCGKSVNNLANLVFNRHIFGRRD